MSDIPFDDVVTSHDELSALYDQPHPIVLEKVVGTIHQAAAEYIGQSPFVLVGTSGADGRADVSPRGGPPGFVQVLDERRLAIPDLNGNNRIDTIRNLIDRPHIGLLFLIPGQGETLRINGRAWVTTSAEVLDGFTAELRRPTAAIGVEVEESFIHCAKAFRRSRLWDPASWPADEGVAFEIIRQHHSIDVPGDVIRADLEAGYVVGLDADKPR